MPSDPRRVRVHPDELAPTQASIGRFEVSLKRDRFRLMGPRDLDGYLDQKAAKGKPVQVVRGLGRFFVVDGHHTLSGIIAAENVPQPLWLEQVADRSNLDEARFWASMREKGWVLERALGDLVRPQDFPSRLVELTDDPFRSLAWLIRKMGAFEDLKRPYQEFVVADFLREQLEFMPRQAWDYELAAVRAYERLRSSTAEARAADEPLLGFISTRVEDDLVERYYAVLEKARAPRYYDR